MVLKFYTGRSKWLKIKFRKLLGANSYFVEVTGKKPIGGILPPILNRVNVDINIKVYLEIL